MTTLYSDNPVVLSLEALLPKGLDSLSPELVHALGRDDESAALELARDAYSRTRGENVVDVLIYTVLLLHRELPDEAIGVLRKGLSHHADEVALQLVQIDGLFAMGEHDSALALMDAVMEVPMASPRHWAFLGDLYWDTGQLERAQTAYEQAMERGSDNPDVALRLADLYADQEQFEISAEFFERAARLAPSEVALWMAVCEAWMGLQRWDRARHAAKRCTTLADDDPDAWALLGVTCRESADYGEALKAFEKARSLAPDEPVNWLNLGEIQLTIGLPEEARQSYQRAAQLDPDDVEALNGQVAAAYDLGDLELAQRLARQALDLDPEQADSWYNLGAIALSLRQGGVARAALEEARLLEPGNPRLTAALATAVLLEGEVDDAMALIDEALSAVRDDAEIVLDFAQIMFRHGGALRVLELLDRVECDDPVWNILVPTFEFLARALRRDPDFSGPLLREFATRVRTHPQAIPVLWDFEELEQLSFALEDATRERFLGMLAVLDGRKSVDTLDDLAA